ncbi:hypothetical protein K6Y31_01185 [Motilimonas cestriensis]|uniref:Uncharacterized protein n=1 Tax=Motilimonas cestriensis TaxID=2742685 RepID=A0ABS8W6M3_9GAMM|nr:hypothetical protein [Motilimonas cestriensis]MCE2593434.1 hypothetical protein [Motilimonas cestriensis]
MLLFSRAKSLLLSTLLFTSLTAHSANLLIEETFDNLPDWHSGLPENGLNLYGIHDGRTFGEDKKADFAQRRTAGHILPGKFLSARQQGQHYSPRNGYQNHHEIIEILTANSDKALAKQGKSAVFWREPTQDNSHEWTTDGILTLYLPDLVAGKPVFDSNTHQGLDEVYFEFWITFSDNTTVYPPWQDIGRRADMSKIARVASFDERGSEYQGFSGGDKGPTFIWNWMTDYYGVRNVVTVRGGPHGHSYTFSNGELSIRQGSLNFVDMLEGMGPNGSTERPLNLRDGGIIDSAPVHHAQIFGSEHDWVKMGFYVKMNSAMDARDGILIQWMNGRRLLTVTDIPYQRSERNPGEDVIVGNDMVKWNIVAIGGNDFFHSWPKESLREEWYAIDNLRIYDGLPDFAETDINGFTMPPKPPLQFTVITK